MPRSKLQNWASKRRLEFIEDTLLSVGYVNRETLQSYFGLERSLGSMDITAYQKAGGILRKAKAGEVMPDGLVVRGYKLGGRLLYVAGEGFEPVMGSTLERRGAWEMLPHSVPGGHAEWLSKVMTAWREDHPFANAQDAMDYFGIGGKEAKDLIEVFSGRGVDVERAKVWGLFR